MNAHLVQQNVKKNIRLLGAMTLCTNMMFVLPVIMPYYRDQMGLGFKEFLIGEAAFAATVVILEVPTGWISDVWQRKQTLALGIFFDLLGFACLLAADSFFMAVTAQCLIGVGISLMSGTNSAFLYDTLLSANREKEFRKFECRRQATGLYSVAIASVLGGLMYPLHHQLPVALCLIFLVMGIIFACALDEPLRHKKRAEKHPLADMAETVRYAVKGHAEVGFIIAFAAIMFSATKIIMWTQQPYYMELKLPESWYGVLMAAGFIMGGLSSQMGHLIDGKIGTAHALGYVLAMALAVCLGAGLLPLGMTGAALLMFGGTCLFGIGNPRVQEAINQRVGSERRATVLSTANLMISLMFMPISWAVGALSDEHGIQFALLGVGAWLGVSGIMLALWAYRRR